MLRCKCRKRTPPNAWIETQHAMKETTPRTLRDSFEVARQEESDFSVGGFLFELLPILVDNGDHK